VKLIVPILLLSLPVWAETAPQKAADLTPVQTTPTNTTKPSTGDVDMKQFKNIPPARKGAKVDVNISCVRADGTSVKKGDRGYKECLEIEENRLMKKNIPPEAAPNDPRTN